MEEHRILSWKTCYPYPVEIWNPGGLHPELSIEELNLARRKTNLTLSPHHNTSAQRYLRVLLRYHPRFL